MTTAEIVSLRGPKNVLDPWRPYAAMVEDEIGEGGLPIPTATLFLTNRECPFRCLMCDLWKNTLDDRTPLGAIPAQIDHALATLPPARQIKLYNAGSFFDPAAIPPGDHDAIAARVRTFERVIVECHPAFIGPKILPFRDRLAGKLEVAIGLESVHPDVLARLNKRMTVADFERAAAFLRENGIDLRVFLLVRPPFLTEKEGVDWACRSLDVAFDAGASVCCVIPTRAGNGAMEALQTRGDFSPPSIESLEAVLDYGLGLKRGRVFADLWDLDPAETVRLAAMNRTQDCRPHPQPLPRRERGVRGEDAGSAAADLSVPPLPSGEGLGVGA